MNDGTIRATPREGQRNQGEDYNDGTIRLDGGQAGTMIVNYSRRGTMLIDDFDESLQGTMVVNGFLDSGTMIISNDEQPASEENVSDYQSGTMVYNPSRSGTIHANPAPQLSQEENSSFDGTIRSMATLLLPLGIIFKMTNFRFIGPSKKDRDQPYFLQYIRDKARQSSVQQSSATGSSTSISNSTTPISATSVSSFSASNQQEHQQQQQNSSSNLSLSGSIPRIPPRKASSDNKPPAKRANSLDNLLDELDELTLGESGRSKLEETGNTMTLGPSSGMSLPRVRARRESDATERIGRGKDKWFDTMNNAQTLVRRMGNVCTFK